MMKPILILFLHLSGTIFNIGYLLNFINCHLQHLMIIQWFPFSVALLLYCTKQSQVKTPLKSYYVFVIYEDVIDIFGSVCCLFHLV